MFRMKRINSYLLKTFFGLFSLTFPICIFILLMQFLWMHINDLVGKGVEVLVLAEFFLYAMAHVVQLALPLAILLGSLMTFGNLGENVELTAMKAAGISLFKIMRPLTITIVFVCVAAFGFSNYVLPIAQTKLWTLIFSLRQKSPELEIPVGEFYNGIDGYNIYVRERDPQRGMLKNMMIYDFSSGFNNATVMVADSGKVYLTEDKKYLLLELWSGESFENLKKQNIDNAQKTTPYRRETFAQKKILIDFDSDFNRYDESLLGDQHINKGVLKLISSIDSMSVVSNNKARSQSDDIVQTNYFGRERAYNRVISDTVAGGVMLASVDSLYASMTLEEQHRVAQEAVEKARTMRDQVTYNKIMLNDSIMYIRRHQIEMHRKFTLAFACLIFFFIGAPLGAIVRKGGLGMPVVISVVMFIIYYIIDNAGYKMAREGLWTAVHGMWLSSAVLLPVGIFLTYKAATDSGLLNIDVWAKMFDKVRKLLVRKSLGASKKSL